MAAASDAVDESIRVSARLAAKQYRAAVNAAFNQAIATDGTDGARYPAVACATVVANSSFGMAK